ncbi:hypothetical protein NKH77_44420 [Streptomyces sp. M19]
MAELRAGGREARLVRAADLAGPLSDGAAPDPARREVLDLSGLSHRAAGADHAGRYRAVLDHAAELGRAMASQGRTAYGSPSSPAARWTSAARTPSTPGSRPAGAVLGAARGDRRAHPGARRRDGPGGR